MSGLRFASWKGRRWTLGRASVLQEIRTMRFEEVYERWTEHRLTQQEEADLLSVSERQFRRQCRRYESDGLDGLIDLRLGQVSTRRAPVYEVLVANACSLLI